MIAFHDKIIEQRISELAKVTGHKKSFFVKEALKLTLDDLEDIHMALSRLKDAKFISLEEFEAKIGLDNRT